MSEAEGHQDEHPADCAYCRMMAGATVGVTGAGTEDDPWVIHVDGAGSASEGSAGARGGPLLPTARPAPEGRSQ